MKVSVIIPIYNAAEYLEKSLGNYIKQSYTNLEYILVDDGSKDNSLDICKKFEKQYNNITVITQENQGVSAARNKGLMVAKGEYVAFFDADDYVDDNMIEKLVLIAQEYKLDVVGCGLAMEIERRNGKRIRQSQLFYEDYLVVFSNKDQLKENILKIWEKNIPYNIVNKIYRKKFLSENEISFSSLKMGEDLEFNMQVLLKCKNLALIPECYYQYIRNRIGAATFHYVENWYFIRKEENERIKKFFKCFLNTDKLPDNIIEYISRRFVNRAIGCLENEFRNKNTDKLYNIKEIIASNTLQTAIAKGKNYSLKIKLILIPIRKKSVLLTIIVFWGINLVRTKMPELFEYMKYRR